MLYFDTFFLPSGDPVPEETEVYLVREGDPILAEVWQVGGRRHMPRRMSSVDPTKPPKPKVVSFSTGPRSVPTHWKQTLFLLRDPIIADEGEFSFDAFVCVLANPDLLGTVVKGIFKCKKSPDNSRELDVEIHYSVKESPDAPDPTEVIVQAYKVR